MTIEILTVLPELLASPFEHSMMKRAQEKGLLHIKLHNLRDWAINKHGQVDDYQYGGGAGMVMVCEPLANAIDQERKKPTPTGTPNKFQSVEDMLRIPGITYGIFAQTQDLPQFRW
jgi:tRNA (guanine-N1)-methyltransferase